MPIVDTHAHIYSEDVKQYPHISDPYLPAPGYGDIQDLKDANALWTKLTHERGS